MFELHTSFYTLPNSPTARAVFIYKVNIVLALPITSGIIYSTLCLLNWKSSARHPL